MSEDIDIDPPTDPPEIVRPRDPAVSDDRPDDDPGPVLRGVRLIAIVVFVYALFVVVLLSIGFICLLLGVEPASWFVELVYRSVERAMKPFRGVFDAIQFGVGSSKEVEPVVESSILFAMVVYGIIALAAHDLADWIGRRRPG